MKDYENLNKYFNKRPKTFLMVFFVWTIFIALCSIVVIILEPGLNISSVIYQAVYSLAVIGVVMYLYSVQFSLKKARVGKSLLKQADGNEEVRDRWLDEMESEIERAKYRNIEKKKKGCNFAITDNWIIGAVGIYLARMDAVRLNNIKSIGPFVTILRSRGGKAYFYQVSVTDKNGREHRFWMRNEAHMNSAIKYLQGR